MSLPLTRNAQFFPLLAFGSFTVRKYGVTVPVPSHVGIVRPIADSNRVVSESACLDCDAQQKVWTEIQHERRWTRWDAFSTWRWYVESSYEVPFLVGEDVLDVDVRRVVGASVGCILGVMEACLEAGIEVGIASRSAAEIGFSGRRG